MSKSLKLLATFGFIAVVAACAQPEPEPAPAPIESEPVHSGKY